MRNKDFLSEELSKEVSHQPQQNPSPGEEAVAECGPTWVPTGVCKPWAGVGCGGVGVGLAGLPRVLDLRGAEAAASSFEGRGLCHRREPRGGDRGTPTSS